MIATVLVYFLFLGLPLLLLVFAAWTLLRRDSESRWTWIWGATHFFLAGCYIALSIQFDGFDLDPVGVWLKAGFAPLLAAIAFVPVLRAGILTALVICAVALAGTLFALRRANRPARAVVPILTGIIACYIAVAAENRVQQARILSAAERIGADCVNIRLSLFESLRLRHREQPSPGHATATTGNVSYLWSYRAGEFFPVENPPAACNPSRSPL